MNLNPSRRATDMFMVAGWLFADLLLGLSVIFLGSVQFPSIPATMTATPTPTLFFTPTKLSTETALRTPTQTLWPTKTLTPTKTPTPTRTLSPTIDPAIIIPTSELGLDLRPLKIQLQVDTAKFLGEDLETVNIFRSKIDSALSSYRGRRAGLVITLGYNNTVSTGIALARKANVFLKEYFPSIFENIVQKQFWWSLDDLHPSGTIELEIYFYSR